jgi:hypothetical protein
VDTSEAVERCLGADNLAGLVQGEGDLKSGHLKSGESGLTGFCPSNRLDHFRIYISIILMTGPVKKV